MDDGTGHKQLYDDDGVGADEPECFPRLAQMRPTNPPDILLGSAIGCLAAGGALAYMGFGAFGVLAAFLGLLFAAMWAIGRIDGHLQSRRMRDKLEGGANEPASSPDVGDIREEQGERQDVR